MLALYSQDGNLLFHHRDYLEKTNTTESSYYLVYRETVVASKYLRVGEENLFVQQFFFSEVILRKLQRFALE